MATWPQVHGAWTEVRSDPGIRQNNKNFPRLAETAKQLKIKSVRCKMASGTNRVVPVCTKHVAALNVIMIPTFGPPMIAVW